MSVPARPLPCRVAGCPGVLGWVRGGVLTVGAGAKVSVVPAAGRCTVACPACGAANDRLGGMVVVPGRKAAA